MEGKTRRAKIKAAATISTSWIRCVFIVIAVLVFQIGLVVIMSSNLLLEESRSDIQLYHTQPNQELVSYSSRQDQMISGIIVKALTVSASVLQYGGWRESNNFPESL